MVTTEAFVAAVPGERNRYMLSHQPAHGVDGKN
jgi:hypothetical protein